MSDLDHGEEGLSVLGVHQAVGEDPVDLVHPQTGQLHRPGQTHGGPL